MNLIFTEYNIEYLWVSACVGVCLGGWLIACLSGVCVSACVFVSLCVCMSLGVF